MLHGKPFLTTGVKLIRSIHIRQTCMLLTATDTTFRPTTAKHGIPSRVITASQKLTRWYSPSALQTPRMLSFSITLVHTIIKPLSQTTKVTTGRVSASTIQAFGTKQPVLRFMLSPGAQFIKIPFSSQVGAVCLSQLTAVQTSSIPTPALTVFAAAEK